MSQTHLLNRYSHFQHCLRCKEPSTLHKTGLCKTCRSRKCADCGVPLITREANQDACFVCSKKRGKRMKNLEKELL